MSRAPVHTFKSGDLIFKEGAESGSAYVIVKGAVELTKDSPRGPVVLARLKAGELFGEMAVIDGSPRSASARSVGKTVLKEITAEALMTGLHSDVDLSSKVMVKLVERLRAADALLARNGVKSPTSSNVPSVEGGVGSKAPEPAKKSLMTRLFGGKKRKAAFVLAIADLFDDPEASLTAVFANHLQNQVTQWGGGLVACQRMNGTFPVADFTESPMVWGQISHAAQKWLKDNDADLLVWGQLRAQGQVLHLRFAHRMGASGMQGGVFLPCDALDLPLDQGLAAAPEVSTFLYGVLTLAVLPHRKDQRDSHQAVVHSSVQALRTGYRERNGALEPEEQARYDLGYATALSAAGSVLKDQAMLQQAEGVYNKVLRTVRQVRTPLLSGIAYRHLAHAQWAWHKAGGEENLLEAAVENFTRACDQFTKEAYPMDWADLNRMIGQLLYSLDSRQDHQSSHLPESAAAFQRALQIYSASTTPKRWAETKHHLARTLQLLGRLRDDLEMIARSAEACKEALKVVHKTRNPMMWAALQNNLGSALFVLGQHNKKTETSVAAIKAFEAALAVYEARNADRLARVTLKNLTRAKETVLILDQGGEAPTFKPEDFDG